MTTVKFESGVEGPTYDPYAVDVVCVHRAGIEYVYESHALGGDVVEVADHRIICNNDKEAHRIFAQASGGWMPDWQKWYHRAHSRCRCGCRQFKSMRGFPGESFDVCTRCGEVVTSYFHESAII